MAGNPNYFPVETIGYLPEAGLKSDVYMLAAVIGALLGAIRPYNHKDAAARYGDKNAEAIAQETYDFKGLIKFPENMLKGFSINQCIFKILAKMADNDYHKRPAFDEVLRFFTSLDLFCKQYKDQPNDIHSLSIHAASMCAIASGLWNVEIGEREIEVLTSKELQESEDQAKQFIQKSVELEDQANQFIQKLEELEEVEVQAKQFIQKSEEVEELEELEELEDQAKQFIQKLEELEELEDQANQFIQKPVELEVQANQFIGIKQTSIKMKKTYEHFDFFNNPIICQAIIKLTNTNITTDNFIYKFLGSESQEAVNLAEAINNTLTGKSLNNLQYLSDDNITGIVKALSDNPEKSKKVARAINELSDANLLDLMDSAINKLTAANLLNEDSERFLFGDPGRSKFAVHAINKLADANLLNNDNIEFLFGDFDKSKFCTKILVQHLDRDLSPGKKNTQIFINNIMKKLAGENLEFYSKPVGYILTLFVTDDKAYGKFISRMPPKDKQALLEYVKTNRPTLNKILNNKKIKTLEQKCEQGLINDFSVFYKQNCRFSLFGNVGRSDFGKTVFARQIDSFDDIKNYVNDDDHQSGSADQAFQQMGLQK